MMYYMVVKSIFLVITISLTKNLETTTIIRVTALSHPTPPQRPRSPPPKPIEKRIRLETSGKEATLISRTVPIPRILFEREEGEDYHHRNITTSDDDDEEWSITVWEFKDSATIVTEYWDCTTAALTSPSSSSGGSSTILDPFGLVSWPGSVRAAQELRAHQGLAVVNQTVLVLGCGCGLETQAAIGLGARHVVATDIHPSCLQQTKFGVEVAAMKTGWGAKLKKNHHRHHQQQQQQQQQSFRDVLTTQIFDLAATSQEQPLLDVGFDTIVIADVLYNEQLAKHVCRRIVEAVQRNPSCRILITDSQRFVPTFIQNLNDQLRTVWEDKWPEQPYAPLSWTVNSQSFTGSGVIIDEDQTYDVLVQSLWIGLGDVDVARR